MKTHVIIRNVILAQSVLLIPLVAMLFTDEVDWSLGDFVIAGLLLTGIGFAFSMVFSGVNNKSRQAFIGLLLVVSILLLWAELAVGILGTPFAGS